VRLILATCISDRRPIHGINSRASPSIGARTTPRTFGDLRRDERDPDMGLYRHAGLHGPTSAGDHARSRVTDASLTYSVMISA
jgi:hypothetical protein